DKVRAESQRSCPPWQGGLTSGWGCAPNRRRPPAAESAASPLEKGDNCKSDGPRPSPPWGKRSKATGYRKEQTRVAATIWSPADASRISRHPKTHQISWKATPRLFHSLCEVR